LSNMNTVRQFDPVSGQYQFDVRVHRMHC
jgi:hypothetical protein